MERVCAAGAVCRARLSAAQGDASAVAELPGSRRHWVVLRGVSRLPAAAQCDGQALAPAPPAGQGQGPGYWVQLEAGLDLGAVDLESHCLVIACGQLSTAGAHSIDVAF